MECTTLGGAIVCREEMREVKREPNGKERWCFYCRAKRTFEFVVSAPVGKSYYGPSAWIECATCHAADGDLFPGRTREWDD